MAHAGQGGDVGVIVFISMKSLFTYLQDVGRMVLPSRFYCEDGFVTAHKFVAPVGFEAARHRGLATGDPNGPHRRWRTRIALWVARQCLNVPGDFVELGVNYGDTAAAIMCYLDWDSTGKRFWLVDSFDGVRPGPSAEKRDGLYNVSADRARKNLAEWKNQTVIQGWVPDCLGEIAAEQIAFAHIDLNHGKPEAEAYRGLRDRLSPGGFVLLDDYCYSGFGEVQREWDALGLDVLGLPTGQGILINRT